MMQRMKEPTGHNTDRAGMVHWYQPLLLLRTGVRALLATVIGQLADNRELQALDARPQANRWDYRSHDELWVDFVADIGDGWDAGYTVACALAAPELAVDGTNLPRADLLLIGGDLVYPNPSLAAYKERTLEPYQAATEAMADFSSEVFALPGNHDWYDGLHAFQDIFCHDTERDPQWPFGRWRKPQTHSYFAWQLPHGWWVLGPDVQLDGRINPAQRAYFQRVIADFSVGDRVVIVAPYPSWAQVDANANGAALRWLIAQCRKAEAEVKLILTGDLHHYSRYAGPTAASPEHAGDEGELQLITAGGGGAFLHPTHTLAPTVTLEGIAGASAAASFEQQRVWPPAAKSRVFALQNLLFPVRNWELSVFVGFVYTMLAWVLETRILVGNESVSEFFQAMLHNHQGVGETLSRVLAMLPKSPEFALVVLLTALGLTAFNENCTTRSRLLLGALHTLLHMTGFILTYCVAVEITGWLYAHVEALSFSFFWFLLTMILFGGGVGGVVIGVYLALSLNLFGANLTNAFSSLRLESHRNFLRMHITEAGDLRVYPLGIEQPAGPASKVRLIDERITL